MILFGTDGAEGQVARVEGEQAHVYERMRTMLAEWRMTHAVARTGPSRVTLAGRVIDLGPGEIVINPERWLVSADVDVLIRTTFTEVPALGPVRVFEILVGVDSMLPARSILLEANPYPSFPHPTPMR